MMINYKHFSMKYAFIPLLMLVTFAGRAQDPDALKKIESARIALITERLKLTPAQAEKFWPLYREYTEKREALRREFVDARRDLGEDRMTDEESRKLLDKGLELKERQLALERNYTERLNGVITTQQILQLRRAEDDFRQMLLQRIERRREQRDRLQRREDLRNNN